MLAVLGVFRPLERLMTEFGWVVVDAYTYMPVRCKLACLALPPHMTRTRIMECTHGPGLSA